MKRRYSGNDKHWGPFTFSKHTSDHWKPFGVVLDSGGGTDSDPRCHLKVHAFGYTLICEMPRLIHPWRRWVDCSRYEWATEPNAGYWDERPKEYGFTVSDGFLQVFLGPQTHDSTTTKSWCAHLPWTQWRFVRQSWYGTAGEHLQTLWETSSREVRRAQWDWRREFEKTLEKVRFKFKDYDGEEIEVSTNIEEREWRFGEGWFKWLSLFRRPMIKRVLNLEFSAEVGPEKGSWKGGTLGHSIEMLPGELHEEAFRRYCEQEHRSKYRPFRITYVGKVQ